MGCHRFHRVLSLYNGRTCTILHPSLGSTALEHVELLPHGTLRDQITWCQNTSRNFITAFHRIKHTKPLKSYKYFLVFPHHEVTLLLLVKQAVYIHSKVTVIPPPRPSNSLRGRKYVCRRVSRCEMVTDIRDSTFAEESETGKRNYCCCGVNPRDTASVALWLLCWRRWWRWWQRRQKKIHSRRQEWEKRKAVERK